ncbi:hypothetical protein ACJX0J_035727, partial [Zea mays]
MQNKRLAGRLAMFYYLGQLKHSKMMGKIKNDFNIGFWEAYLPMIGTFPPVYIMSKYERMSLDLVEFATLSGLQMLIAHAQTIEQNNNVL